ncbi:hypothetical protein [Streptomyces soliscabiei]|uniref:hypothetical protein n=1 Tax=Streptomyces soliscabiei TaxID=588897 RepID=UPI0029B73FE5|nr:hypothetical protein [Streptomyces sp. NY05-11A]MDX2675010.1 hypothetical protein [Streptomyces sp. NY05-11A]
MVEAVTAPETGPGRTLTGRSWYSAYDDQYFDAARKLDVDHLVSAPATLWGEEQTAHSVSAMPLTLSRGVDTAVCKDHAMVRGAPPHSDAPQSPMGRTSAVSVLAALLDRSVEQIAEAAADVRRFDRETIRATADVWDNNVFPLFWAVSTSDVDERERRAMIALEWMAGLGERRRVWMTEQAAIAGHELDSLLAPAGPYVPGRDYRGHVMTPQCRLTRQNADALVPDYDLATASVRHLQVERAGPRLTAFLQLVADRRFAIEGSTPAPPALLDVWLDGVTDTAFNLSDTRGVILDAGPSEIEISLGTDGRLRAASGEFRLDDRSWHLSAAGRRADAVAPPRTSQSGRLRQSPAGDLGTDAHAAALLLRGAMLELRSVRYASRADHVPVLSLCQAFKQAGEAILAAGSRRGSRRREAAFRDLLRTWAERGGPETARWLAGILKERAGRADLIEVPRAAERTLPSLADGAPVSGAPPQAVLTMAAWTAAHTRYRSEHPGTAQLQLALPPRPDENSSAPWRLRTVSCTDPDAFHLRTGAFQGPGALVQVGKPTAACSFDLHRGALLVSASNGWSASVS